jgi:SAM-dependent methyltransferase
VRQLHATAERTRAALAAALGPFLPATGLVLELGSGSGQHVVHLAGLYPALTWQPSDRDPEALTSIRAWSAEVKAGSRLLAPLLLDVTAGAWPVPRADAILASYLLHVLDDTGREALFRTAMTTLAPGGPLLVFGPIAEGPAVDVGSPFAALRSSVWCPVTEIPSGASVVASARRAGLEPETTRQIEGGGLLVFRRRAVAS